MNGSQRSSDDFQQNRKRHVFCCCCFFCLFSFKGLIFFFLVLVVYFIFEEYGGWALLAWQRVSKCMIQRLHRQLEMLWKFQCVILEDWAKQSHGWRDLIWAVTLQSRGWIRWHSEVSVRQHSVIPVIWVNLLRWRVYLWSSQIYKYFSIPIYCTLHC